MNGSSSESFDLNSSQDSSSSRRNVESFKIMVSRVDYDDNYMITDLVCEDFDQGIHR